MPPKFSRHQYTRLDDKEHQSLLDDSDDDMFLGNGKNESTPMSAMRSSQPPDKIVRLQGQVDEVVGVMRDNIGRVMERGERLEDLQDKSEDLSAHSTYFHKRARDLRRQLWWKECKMRILLVILVLIVLAVIIIPIVIKYHKKSASTPPATTMTPSTATGE